MAKTPILHRLGANGSNSYTVPTGKHLVANIYPAEHSEITMLQVNNVQYADLAITIEDLIMPVRGAVFPAGSVIKSSAAGAAMLTGFLYDN